MRGGRLPGWTAGRPALSGWPYAAVAASAGIGAAIAEEQPIPRLRETSGPRRRLEPDRLGDHLDRLYRAAWGLCGSREDAEDLVQETYARVLRRPRFLGSEEDIGYLLRTLRNTHYSRLRAAARRLRADPLPDDLDRVQDRSVTPPHEAAEASDLLAQIAALPDELRDAVVAVDVAGLSYREAARALGIREATITMRIYRGRQRLLRALEGTEATA